MASKKISIGASVELAILLAFMAFNVGVGTTPNKAQCLAYMKHYCFTQNLSSTSNCARGAMLAFRNEQQMPASNEGFDDFFRIMFLKQITEDFFPVSRDSNFQNNMNSEERCLDALKDFRGYTDIVDRTFHDLFVESYATNLLAMNYLITIAKFVYVDESETIDPVTFCSKTNFHLIKFNPVL